MKKVLALVLAASMILSLAACGGSKSGSQPAEGTTAAAASATTKSDPETLNVYLASEPAHLDPALNSSVDGGCLAVNSFEGLYRYNSEGKLEPACAEGCEVSEDGTTVSRLPLRISSIPGSVQLILKMLLTTATCVKYSATNLHMKMVWLTMLL